LKIKIFSSSIGYNIPVNGKIYSKRASEWGKPYKQNTLAVIDNERLEFEFNNLYTEMN
jgi:hypothetical protein